MKQLPRIALGTLHSEADDPCLLWALFAALVEAGERPTLFHASCRFAPHDVSRAVRGRRSRYLDSWAMTRSDALAALAAGMGDEEIGLVYGAFDRPGLDDPTTKALSRESPSSLDTLCQWLDLPRVAMLDVSRLRTDRPLPRPGFLSGLLLDRARDPHEAAYWQTTLEALWQVPVLGWLPALPDLRAACRALPACEDPPAALWQALGRHLTPTLNLARLLALARRTAPIAGGGVLPWGELGQERFRIALALDDVFCGYYPETLDLLEAAGAELVDFSPLRSGSLPERVEVVYFGCGHPERHASALARNHCLIQDLRCFAARGGRVYAEGGGLAYLCQEIQLPDGTTLPMTGLVPATACWQPQPTIWVPAELRMVAGSWLAPAETTIRGYRHAGWQIKPRGLLRALASSTSGDAWDVLGRGSVIGSRVLINLAANRHLLRRFFQPAMVPSAGSDHP
jgi:cobyrinic acid a,c-diamide synthase